MCADINKTIDIIFGATDNASDVFAGIESKVNTFSSNVTQPLSDAGEAALKTEAAIIGLGVAFLGVAVNESAQFQTSLNEIGTLFNATPEQVEKLKNEVKAFGADSVFSLEDTTEALYNMVSATGDVDNSIAGLTAAQDLATVAGTSLNTSVNSLTTVLNSYGQSMTEADSVSGALFVTVQNGKTTLGELDANLGKVTATAAAAGVPFDELGAATAALTGAGNDTASAMTQLQNLIKELADPTDTLKEAMGGLSLETDGLKPVMDALKDATGGNFVEMNALFGTVEATKGALVLANDSSGTFTNTLQQMADKTGVVSENMILMEKNLDLVTQNMKNNLDLSFIAIGDKLKDEWTDIVDSLSNLFKGTNIALDEGSFDLVFDSLNEFQDAISTYLNHIAKVLPEALEGVDFSGIVDAFEDLGGSIGGIFGSLDLTDVQDLEQAIQFVVDSVESLTRVVSGIVDAWGPAIRTIVGMIDTFNNTSDSSKKFGGELIGLSQVFENFKGLIAPIYTGLISISDVLLALAEVKTASAMVDLGKALTGIGESGGASALSKILSLINGPVGLIIAAGLAGAAVRTIWNEATTDNLTPALKEVYDNLDRLARYDLGFSAQIKAILDSKAASDGTKFELKELLKGLLDLKDEEKKVVISDIQDILSSDISQDLTVEKLQDVRAGLGDVKAAANEAIPEVRDFGAEVENAADSAVNWDLEINAAVEAIATMPGVLIDASKKLENNTDAAGKLQSIWSSLGENGGSADQFKQATKELLEQLSDSDKVYSESEVNTREWIKQTNLQKEAAEKAGDAAGGLTNKIGDLVVSEKAAAEHASKAEINLQNLASNEKIEQAKSIASLHEKMLELASDERISAMEFTATIKVAQIEGQAQQMIAAFDAVASSVSSTNDLIGTLFGMDAPDWDRFGFDTREAADRANDRADALAKSQIEMNDAQIRYLDALAKSLLEGTEVYIQADGLEPEIEAFMFQILRRIQTKVVGDRSAFLLGAG